jgi:general secretion pathway protein C
MSRPWYARRDLELALLVVVTALVALGVNAVLRLAADDVPRATAASPAPRLASEPLDAWAPIAARDIFNGARAASRENGTRRLVGVGLQAGEASAAIEDLRTHRQTLVRVGDTVGDARVDSIAWDHVVLIGDDGEQVLALGPPDDGAGERADAPDEPPGTDQVAGDQVADDQVVSRGPTIRQTSATAFVVDRRELTTVADDMSGLLTQLRAVAEVRDGRPAGFRLFQMKEGSIFRRLGLQNGDVVQRVNGEAVSDPATLLAFLQRLRSEPRVALDIRRGADRQTMVYDLR